MNPAENELRPEVDQDPVPVFRKWALGIGASLLVVGVSAIASGLLAQNRTFETQSWPYVAGNVTTSDFAIDDGKQQKSKLSPVAKLAYSYSVYGQKYVGKCRRVVPMLHSANDNTNEFFKDVGKGSRVLVFYNPNDPKDAVLIPQAGKSALFKIKAIVFGGAFLILTGLVLVCTTETAIFGRLSFQSKSKDEPVADPAPTRKPYTSAIEYEFPWRDRRSKPKLHWALRAISIAVGVLVSLFGIYLIIISNTGTRSFEVSLATSWITSGLMLLMIASGVYMIWNGVTRNGISNDAEKNVVSS